MQQPSLSASPSVSTRAVSYGLCLVVFLLLDGVWLGAVAGAFYKAQLGARLLEAPLLPAALAFYLIYILGLCLFVIWPNLAKPSLAKTGALGAAFGLAAYGTYDLTNLATLRDWPPALSFVDLAWGTFASGLVCVLVISVYRAFRKL